MEVIQRGPGNAISNNNVVHASVESHQSQKVLEMASPTVRGWVQMKLLVGTVSKPPARRPRLSDRYAASRLAEKQHESVASLYA